MGTDAQIKFLYYPLPGDLISSLLSVKVVVFNKLEFDVVAVKKVL